MPVFKDKQGLKITASSRETVKRMDDFTDALLGFSLKAGGVITIADEDPDCILAQAYAAQLYASGETRALIRGAQKYQRRAEALAPSGTAREQAIVATAGHWVRTERRAGARILDQVLEENPTDILSAKWAQALHYDTGNQAGILRAPLRVARACDDNAYLHGMLAFGYEECHLLDQAEASVLRAMDLNRVEPWAHHAMAHINEGRNHLEKGVSFMNDVSDTWQGLSSFMLTHNWWHLCLFLVDLGRGDEALDIFDTIVWGIDRTCVQDQINAISLLYRLERTGVDVGARWQSVAENVAANSADQVSVFLDFQFLYVLSRANHPEGKAMEERMMSRAETAAPDERIAWEKTARVGAPGIRALALGDYKKAAQHLGDTRVLLRHIGGSHAQRELFTLFFIDALRGAGEWGRVQQILVNRQRARPQVSWLKSQLNEAYHNLGLGEVAVP